MSPFTAAARSEPNDPAPESAAPSSAPARRRNVQTRQVEEIFARQRTGRDRLPDPRPFIVNLSRYVIEILAGVRDLDQIARWLERPAYDTLLRTVAIEARARQARGQAAVWPRYQLGALRIDSPADGVIECATVVHRPPRVRAIAMRLVGLDGRWLAEHIGIV